MFLDLTVFNPAADQFVSVRFLFAFAPYGAVTAEVQRERVLFHNLLVRVHRCFWYTGLAPWEFESPFPGSLISTFLGRSTPCT